MFKLRGVIFLIVIAASMSLYGQDYRRPLYEGVIPNSKPAGTSEKIDKTDITRISNVQVPDIAVYLPTKRFATGQAVVICPGGGYGGLSYDLEGTDVARYFNSIGIAGIILKYRLPSPDCCVEPHKAPLMDAQRAMRLVRDDARRWNIDPRKVGVMGFSAGGHLASTLGTHFDYGNSSAQDPVERLSCRPDFMILFYPVITFTDAARHTGSRKALLGDNPHKDLILYYSNELQVKPDTPRAFFVHANNDDAVPVENTLLMYQALRKNNIPTELHILSEGGHGFGLALGNEHVAGWMDSLKLWLRSINDIK